MSVNEKMTAIADAIRGYTGRNDKLSLDGMATGVSEVFGTGNQEGYNRGYDEGLTEGRTQGYGLGFEEGKIAERDAFWDVFQNKGSAKSYYYAFSYNRFNAETFKPKYDIVCNNSGTAAQNMFYNSTTIRNIPVAIDVRNTSHIGATFYSATNLKSVKKIIIGSGVISGGNTTFYNCYALESITFEGEIAVGINFQWCTLLNKASIESIINALSATTSGLTVTFSKTAVNNAFTAEEWEALEATKTNWTISLV